MTPQPIMQRRVAAAQATLDHFQGQPFAWGKADCARLAAFVLRELGYRRLGLAKAGSYATANGARKALARAGFDSLEAALDARLVRIPPAAALPADIVALEADDGEWPALCVALGHKRVLGFHKDLARVLVPIRMVAAWRASPCPK